MMEVFLGYDLTFDQAEDRGMLIHPVHREGEATLMKRRWFDYRKMHPVIATYCYAHYYKRQTQAFYAKCVDTRTAEEVIAFTPDDIFSSRDLTSMWLARRAADQYCIPYPFVLNFAQERFLSRAQRTFPRPNQLYGEEFEQDLLSAWKEQLARQITYSSSPFFKHSAWSNSADQRAHKVFVLAQVAQRPAPRYRLLARLLIEDILSVEEVEQRFGSTEATQALTYAQKLR